MLLPALLLLPCLLTCSSSRCALCSSVCATTLPPASTTARESPAGTATAQRQYLIPSSARQSTLASGHMHVECRLTLPLLLQKQAKQLSTTLHADNKRVQLIKSSCCTLPGATLHIHDMQTCTAATPPPPCRSCCLLSWHSKKGRPCSVQSRTHAAQEHLQCQLPGSGNTPVPQQLQCMHMHAGQLQEPKLTMHAHHTRAVHATIPTPNSTAHLPMPGKSCAW